MVDETCGISCQGASGYNAADSINHRPAAAVFMRAGRFRIRKICRKTHKFRQIRQFVIFEFYGLYLIYIYMYQS